MSLLLGATVYTFSIILAVFLFGLGIGSALGAALARSSREPGRYLGISQLLLAPAVAWSAYMIHGSLPYWPIAPSLTQNPWMSFQLDLIRCLWAILPATLLWGASFPLALASAAGGRRDSGGLVASVYVANTVGAILGALAFTFWLTPSFGSQGAQRILIGLSAAAGLFVLAIQAWPPWKGARHATGAVALVLAAILALKLIEGVPPLPGALVALGRSLAFRLGARNPQTGEHYQPNILYVGEGMNESVAVSGNERVRLFHVSGKIEASTSPKDMRLQRMLAEVPALIHPEPRSALIVGFGAGVTAGSFVPYPSISRIVICELEPLIPQRVSGYFSAENFDVVSDPRVQIVYDDARHYMLTSRERFDVITSDPIHPWVRGSAALYSQDYFELVRRHLNPGGVVSQWVPLYQSSDSTIRGELATFFSVFPTGTIWANNERGQGYDLVLVGTGGPAAIDLGQVEARLRRPDYARVRQSLEEVGFHSGLELFSTYAGRNTDLGSWLAGAEINRDRRLWLQYRAGLESYTEQEVDIYSQLARFRRFPDDLFVGSDSLKRALMGSAGQPSVTP